MELNIVERASDNTIGRTLKKTRSSPTSRSKWVIPPQANAAFVAGMEDVLEVCQRRHDPHHPVVCRDETTKQLIKETRVPIPARPGRIARHDYEYERNGTVNLFMLFAPLEGWRSVEVTDRHAALDYAQVLRDLSDRYFPGASKIVLVQDNLSTHKPTSLYEAFPAAKARRLNICGAPSISVPMAMHENGLPLSIHSLAKQANDGLLLQLAVQLERAPNGKWNENQRPPIHVTNF